MKITRIGVLGASGDIGRGIVAALTRIFHSRGHPAQLTLATRRPSTITLPPSSHETGALVSKVQLKRSQLDVGDHAALARFASELDVVVNAVGPSHENAETSASIVLAAGAHYVDVGGPADSRTLHVQPVGNRSALFHAGAAPGASGIVPRWLLSRQQNPQKLTVITGGCGSFTRAGAEDYLAGVDRGDVEPLAAWRDGQRASRAVFRQENAILDGFPEPVTLFPYLDADAEMIARSSGIITGTWYSAMAGDRVVDLLMLAMGMGLKAGSSWLRDASVAAAAGRRPYMFVLAETETEGVILSAPTEGALAAEMATAATLEVLAGKMPPKVATAASILDANRVLSVLTCPGTGCSLTRQGQNSDLMEEGAL